MATLKVHVYYTPEGEPEYLAGTQTNDWEGYTARQARTARVGALRAAGRSYEKDGDSLTIRSTIYPQRSSDKRIDVREVLTWTD